MPTEAIIANMTVVEFERWSEEQNKKLTILIQKVYMAQLKEANEARKALRIKQLEERESTYALPG
jgi:hypothetical protein